MSETTVKLPDKTKDRIVGLIAQGQELQKHISDTIIVALEALGCEGAVKTFDPETGNVTLESLNGVEPNRATRRRKTKEKEKSPETLSED